MDSIVAEAAALLALVRAYPTSRVMRMMMRQPNSSALDRESPKMHKSVIIA